MVIITYRLLSYHSLFHITLPSFSDRVDTTTVVLPVDLMFGGILDRPCESPVLTKRDIEELDTVFRCIFVSHLEELVEIFLGTRIETRGIERDPESFCEFG